MTLDREELERTIALGDLDACVRTVDAICSDREWESLLFFADGCRAACARGFQLWPAAEYARYRAALDAPAPIAAQTLVESAVALGLGSLAEVAASTHTWAELAPHVRSGPIAVLALHERVVRGEDCSGIDPGALPGPPVLDVPLELLAWEPHYPVATYRADRVEAPPPTRPGPEAMLPIPPGRVSPHAQLTDADSMMICGALRLMTRGWRSDPEIVTRAIGVDGGCNDAVRGLVADGRATTRIARISGAEALAHLAWVAANGGPLGRRRGMAVGRDDAWNAAFLLCGYDLEADGIEPEGVLEALEELEWAWWDRGTPRGEWSVGLAIADVEAEQAWAFEVE